MVRSKKIGAKNEQSEGKRGPSHLEWTEVKAPEPVGTHSVDWFYHQGPLLTVIDGAAVAAEVGFHQRSLFLALLGPASARPSVHVGLDHQGLLALFLLLLLQEHPLVGR